MDTLYGEISVPDWPDDLIVKALQHHGEWGAVETRIFSEVVPDGATFWDIGAFLGTFSLGLARHRTLGRVLAAEANQDLVPFLRTNLDRHLPCPVEALNVGVGQKTGWLIPQNVDETATNHGAQSYALSTAPGPPGEAPAVACTTLRQLRLQHGNYDALKLDVEGLELEVLKGDFTYIRDHKPMLWLECNETPESLQLLPALKSLGYAPLYYAFPAFRKDNYKQCRDPAVTLVAYEAALLAVPESRLPLIPEQIEGEDIILRRVNTQFDLRKAMFDTPRWGARDWLGLSRAELLAQLSRCVRGQTFKDFLGPGLPR